MDSELTDDRHWSSVAVLSREAVRTFFSVPSLLTREHARDAAKSVRMENSSSS